MAAVSVFARPIVNVFDGVAPGAGDPFPGVRDGVEADDEAAGAAFVGCVLGFAAGG